MKHFKSPRQVQRFLSIHDQIATIFTRCPNQATVTPFRIARNQAFTRWAEVTGVAMAASSRPSIAVTQSVAPFAILSTTS
jgi:putative transposase